MTRLHTLGLLGGMSWESSALYYRLINEQVRDRLGPLRSAPLVMHSFDFGPIAELQHEGRWDEAGNLLADAAERLETAGAEALLICTNTMHKLADRVAERTSVPLLHIGDCTADRLVSAGARTVALLGTKFTMEEDFYRARLEARGLEVLVPPADARAEISRIIYDELCTGRILDSSRETYRSEIVKLVERGADAAVLACTEIGLLIGARDVPVPVFDTTEIHARAGAEFAMDGQVQPRCETRPTSDAWV